MSENAEKNAVLKQTLYLVATPIGNMSDITERAVKVLSEADFIAAEDTRKTGLLLNRLGISSELISYYDHNKEEKGPKIIERIKNGESCALVTDAGTPAISDPGEDLVKIAIENGIRVISIPGACAAIAAITVSGLTAGRFVFEGFLPTDNKKRRERLVELARESRTVILYEAPHRIRKTLTELLNSLGDRKISLCREMTKLNEEIIRTSLSAAIDYYEEKEPRGEYVLILEGSSTGKDSDYPESITEHVDCLISTGLSRMDAIKAAAKIRGVPKSSIYDEYTGRKQ
ncbi:MAG: 16S rRNA (cytidine(1402)-2'-O)-methyltransferase [Clostridia bacterium]|nr:16S rRNA (cytidine(1402)-2'-O)-methyltransferase [Clostridia bacterium]